MVRELTSPAYSSTNHRGGISSSPRGQPCPRPRGPLNDALHGPSRYTLRGRFVLPRIPFCAPSNSVLLFSEDSKPLLLLAARPPAEAGPTSECPLASSSSSLIQPSWSSPPRSIHPSNSWGAPQDLASSKGPGATPAPPAYSPGSSTAVAQACRPQHRPHSPHLRTLRVAPSSG